MAFELSTLNFPSGNDYLVSYYRKISKYPLGRVEGNAFPKIYSETKSMHYSVIPNKMFPEPFFENCI